MAISLLAYVATFSGQLCFWRSYFFSLLRSNYFDTTLTFSGQLFRLSRSSYFRTVTISEAATSCSIKQKVFLQISNISQENTCARVSFLMLTLISTLLKKRLWYRCFSVNFAKFLRTPFLTEHLWATGSVICSSYFLAIAKLLQSSHFLRIESYLRYLLFGEAIFLAEELFRIKISIEELLVQSRYFCIASTFSGEQHFRKS